MNLNGIVWKSFSSEMEKQAVAPFVAPLAMATARFAPWLARGASMAVKAIPRFFGFGAKTTGGKLIGAANLAATGSMFMPKSAPRLSSLPPPPMTTGGFSSIPSKPSIPSLRGPSF